MRFHWDTAQDMLHDILMTNRGWHTRDTKCGASMYAIGTENDYGASDDLVVQEVAHLWIDIGVLTK